MRIHQYLLGSVCVLLIATGLAPAQNRGVVKFNGLPVPGATVVATQGNQKLASVTDLDGLYAFPGLPRGNWTITVQMSGFAEARNEVDSAKDAPATEWELKMLPLEAMNAKSQTAAAKPTPRPAEPQTRSETPAQENINSEELAQRAADGFLINGSVNNSASSPFSLSNAFGNNRRGNRSLYSGNIGVVLGNSALDARPYSLTGQSLPRPDYNRIQGLLAFGGPLRIPGLLRRNAPNLTVNYQWSRTRNVTTQTGLMPTEAERRGELGDRTIPLNQISAQARSLLNYYPLPNFASNAPYNYQVPIIGDTHQDQLQTRVNQRLPRRNQLSGLFAYSNTRSDNPSIFGFLDKNENTGLNSAVSWVHMFSQRFYTVLGTQFSRSVARVTPFFADRVNVSGEAGIAGNNQEPTNWGPPSLNFSSGIAGLSDSQFLVSRNQTAGVSLDVGWNRGRHNLLLGGLFRRQQFNVLGQEDPRGTLSFTGQAAGSDLAGFLLGVPDTSSIAFGNADKYLRASVSAVHITDDWRLRPGFTLNMGVRWEYSSPVTELYGRLVNLEIAPGFRQATPLLGGNAELIHPDRSSIAPRAGFAWRPFPASSTVIRGGYGIYHDTSVYQAIASQMAQQAPFSTSLRAENSAATPLSLANAFSASSAITRNTFAVDPDFRIGYTQNWQLSIQRDLPASLVIIGTYLGGHGTRAQQRILPNTFPTGALNLCPDCPAGFVYLMSNGNSTRHAGQIELRRRLRSGFTATVQYTFAKSIDDAALGGRNQGGALVAQNWLDLRSERGLSNFHQQHLLSVQAQYTTGMGLRGGTLTGGWKGALLKDWTLSTQINAGSGLPLTPIYFAAVRGSGVTGSIRPDYTGEPLYDAPPGFFLNPGAYVAPASGLWGNAGRNSIIGPSQFTLNGSMSRTFRMSDRLSLDLRIEAVNALNHPVFPSWNATVTSAQFGLPNPANPMRSVQTLARLRF